MTKRRHAAGTSPPQPDDRTGDRAASELHRDAQRVPAARPDEDDEADVDAAVDMTFPASDPPAWMGSLVASTRGARSRGAQPEDAPHRRR